MYEKKPLTKRSTENLPLFIFSASVKQIIIGTDLDAMKMIHQYLHCDFGGMTNMAGDRSGNSSVFSLNGITVMLFVSLAASGSFADTDAAVAFTGLLCGETGDTTSIW